MIAEIVVILIVFVLGYTILQLEHHTEKAKWAIIVVVGLFLIITLLGIFNSNDVQTSSVEGVIHGIGLYIGWLVKTLGNLWSISVEATGQVIKTVNFELWARLL